MNSFIGGASVIAPRPIVVADPFPFSPLLGYPVQNLGMPQPLGYQRIVTGPNSDVYRPITDLGMLLRQAADALRQADYQLALVHLDPVIATAPAEGNAWMLLAQALFGAGVYDKAAESLHRAMRLLPREAWGVPVTRPAEYFASAAEYEARLRALEDYVQRFPNVGAAHYVLGYHYGYRGRDADAVRELNAAVRLLTGSDRPLAEQVMPRSNAAGQNFPPHNIGPLSDAPRPGLPLDDDEIRPAPAAARALPREF